MNLLKSTMLVAGCLLCVGVAWSAIYQSRDKEGNVVFSDEPGSGAEKVDLPPLPTYTAPKITPKSSIDKETGEGKKVTLYKSLDIVSPKADETIRENAGNVTVQARLSPALKRSSRHKIQFYLDGQPIGSASASLQATFVNVDRGTHSVDAAVVDSSGKEFIRSSPVVFHLQRVALGGPRAVPLPR